MTAADAERAVRDAILLQHAAHQRFAEAEAERQAASSALEDATTALINARDAHRYAVLHERELDLNLDTVPLDWSDQWEAS